MIVIRGASPEEINFVTSFLQKMDQNVFAAAADDVQKYLERVYRIEDLLRQPGVIESLENLSNVQKYDEQELDRFFSNFQSRASSSQGGGALSLGFFSIGGGGEAKQETEAQKQHRRDLMRKFVADLNQRRLTGKWPVHPQLN